MLRDIHHTLLDLVYPRLCAVCNNWTGEENRVLCWDCRARLRWITPPFCRCCGDPVEGLPTHDFVCGYCLRSPPAFDLARSLLRYAKPCDALIQRFKYGRDCWIGDTLAQWLREGARLHLPFDLIDVVMAVPLSPRKQRERTYNQAGLLARGLARRTPIAYCSGLTRVRYTVSQTRLDMAARRRNVYGAFEVRIPEWIESRRILLIDDVMTTGATLHECARVLKRSGAAAVYGLTVARG